LMMDTVLGYKHQHMQESYLTGFFCQQNNLRKGPVVPRHDCQRPQPE
jgi:hypothetical protein